MNAIKKTVLATAVLMSMGAGAAQATSNVNPLANYSFTGAFVMFSGADPTFSDPAQVVDNGNGILGDAVSGTMSLDTVTGAGTATMLPSTTFFGDPWSATGISLQATMNPGEVLFSMLFNWGAADPLSTCGVTNCDIGVTGAFQMFPTADPMVSGFFTTQSNMPAGPFAGFQPTFNGQATFTGITAAIPEASTYGMMLAGLGLVGFAARRRQQKTLAA